MLLRDGVLFLLSQGFSLQPCICVAVCVTIHRRIVEPFVALCGRCLLNGVCVCVCVWMTQQSVFRETCTSIVSATGTVTQCQLPQSVYVCVCLCMDEAQLG